MGDFEKDIDKLEEITRRLQTGEEGLERSMALYAQGIELAESLQKKLNDFKTKIDILETEGSGHGSNKRNA